MKSIALLAALIACGRPAPDTYLSGLHAIDDKSAVALLTTPGDGYSIALIDSQGRVRWHSKVPGDPYVIGPYNGINVIGDVVTIRYGHVSEYRKSDHAVAGYSLRNGTLLWDTLIAKYTPLHFEGGGESEADLPVYVSSLPVAGKLALFTDTGTTGARFDAIDVTTGKIVATQPTKRNGEMMPMAVGARVFTHRVSETKSYDVTGKPSQELTTWFEGCVIGDEYVALEAKPGSNAGSELVAYKNGEPTMRRVIASPFQKADRRFIVLRRCARYRDRMVFMIGDSTNKISVVGTHWFTFAPYPSWILSSFDGATGELTASKRLHVYYGVGDVLPYHVVNDRVWIYGQSRGPASRPNVGVLDAATLDPVFVRGIQIADVVAGTKKQLGR